MNTMQNVNCCEGCFYNGVTDGYKPECCNCPKVAEYMKTKMDTEYIPDYIDELLTDTEQSDTFQDYKKALRMQRRIAAKKHARKAPKSLAIVNAKLDRLPISASLDDFQAANKKYYNTGKKAVCSYQTSIALAFPEIPKGLSFGCNVDALNCTIYKWKIDKDASPEMKIACADAISILEVVSSYYGQLIGLHREGNVLKVKIGFHDKVSKLDFIRRTSA